MYRRDTKRGSKTESRFNYLKLEEKITVSGVFQCRQKNHKMEEINIGQLVWKWARRSIGFLVVAG